VRPDVAIYVSLIWIQQTYHSMDSHTQVVDQRIDFLGNSDPIEGLVIIIFRNKNPLVSDTPDDFPTLLPAKVKVALSSKCLPLFTRSVQSGSLVGSLLALNADS